LQGIYVYYYFFNLFRDSIIDEKLLSKFWSPTLKRKKYKRSNTKALDTNRPSSYIHFPKETSSTLYQGSGEPCQTLNKKELSLADLKKNKMQNATDVSSTVSNLCQRNDVLFPSGKTSEKKMNYLHKSLLKPPSSHLNFYCLTDIDISSSRNSPTHAESSAGKLYSIVFICVYSTVCI